MYEFLQSVINEAERGTVENVFPFWSYFIPGRSEFYFESSPLPMYEFSCTVLYCKSSIRLVLYTTVYSNQTCYPLETLTEAI